MRKKLLWTAIASIIAVAIATFIFALFTHGFSEESSIETDMFFDESEFHAIQGIIEVENNDFSHPLGERFTVRYRIQYAKELVNPNFDTAFKFIEFQALEVEGEPKISHRKVGTYQVGVANNYRDIYEYTYEVEVFFLNALVDNVYELPPVKIDFVYTEGTIQTYIRVFNETSIYVTRNVTDPSVAEYKDLKQSFGSNENTIKRLFSISGWLFRVAAAFLVALLIFGNRKKVADKVTLEKNLIDKFNKFRSVEWVTSAPAVSRMRELRALALEMAYVFNTIEPLEFYSKFAVGELRGLFNLVDSPKDEISHSDVETAFKATEQLLSLPQKRVSKARKVFKAMFVPIKKLVQFVKFIWKKVRKKGGK